MALRHLLFDIKLRSAWSRTLQLWKPLALWTFLVWIVLTIIVVPLTSALIQWGFIRGDRLAVSNEEILSWIFTPTGLTYILLLGGLGIVASVTRFAGIFQIVTCHMKEDPITVKQLALEILPVTPKLFRLSIFTMAVALAISSFILSGVGVIYLIFLSGQDINYYLEATPTEWTAALITAGIWLFATGGFVLYVLARSSVALPAFLDCNITIRKAVKNSWDLMGRQSVSILKILGFAVSAWFLLLLLTDLILLSATTFAIDKVSPFVSGPRTISSIAGVYILLSQIIKSVIGFLGFSIVSVLITKFYHEDTRLHETAPPAPGYHQLKSAISSGFDRYYSPMRAAIAMIILAVSGFGIGAISINTLHDKQDTTIIAHRAGPPPAPENTIAALDRAIDQGAGVAEIDVMRTADGTVIVFHDRDMMRMARDPRRIENVQYSDIRPLVQIPDSGILPEERRITTLKEMLMHGKDRINFMIELKYYEFDPRLSREVLEIVRNTGMKDQVSIASLQIDPINELYGMEPDLETGYISAISIGNLTRLPVGYIAVQHQQISGELINRARDQGIKIYAWTTNSSGQIASMINMGVDGIITDYPARAAFIADEMSEMTIAERLILSITGWQSSVEENPDKRHSRGESDINNH
ncbi:MAG: glycerophosphodiester phosphodiesterase family protein [Balneolaceae bacterium]